MFSTKNHNIQLKRGQSSYLLHELGHFVSALKGRNGKKIDQSSEFTRIYNEEKSAYVGNNKAYVTQDAAEYFAESFRDYTENPSALKSQRPETYSYISQMVSSLSSSDVTQSSIFCQGMELYSFSGRTFFQRPLTYIFLKSR